jgi:hypothetical protein
MLKKLIAMMSVFALGALPVAASAAPVANPAASLSMSKSVRSGATTSGKNKAAGGGAILGLLIGAGVIAIVAVAASKSDNSSSR